MEWDKFLSQYFTAVKNIRRYQHFRVEKARPGVVFVKTACSAEEEELTVLKQSVSAADVAFDSLPPVLQPGGISAQRLQYLEKEIRQYLHEDSLPPWLDDVAQE